MLTVFARGKAFAFHEVGEERHVKTWHTMSVCGYTPVHQAGATRAVSSSKGRITFGICFSKREESQVSLFMDLVFCEQE